MRKITIETPQNVQIDIESAGFMPRGVAFLLDVVFKILLIILVFWFISFLNLQGNTEMVTIYILGFPVVFFYSLLFELFMHGQTPGKFFMGINVRMLDGTELTPNACMIRWFVRVIDVYITVGALAGLLINATEKEQRLGDLLAGTIVTKKKKNLDIDAEALGNIQKDENYQPLYQKMTRLKEVDVLLIKNTILRYERYNNKAHFNALEELTDKLVAILELNEQPKNKMVFLKTCIKDYIILTR